MAKFIGTVRGERGAATRCGYSKMTGIVSGWNNGVRVEAFIGVTGREWYKVYATCGSNRGAEDTFICSIVDNKVIIPEVVARKLLFGREVEL